MMTPARSPTTAPASSSSSTPLPSSNYFLGIELSNEQFRAALVDDQLNTVGVEIFDFDAELPEYQTRLGVITGRNDGPYVPVELWIRGLDRLFEKLRARFDLSRVKTIGGCAQLSTVWWRRGASSQLSHLSSTLPLHQQLSPSALALLHVPLPQDTTTQSQSLTLESTLGAPGGNTAAHLSLPATQILKIRETDPEAWGSTERVMLASAFLVTLLLGKWAPMGESELVSTGLWDHSKNWWDEGMLDLLAGSKEASVQLRNMLGEVERSGSKTLGTVAPYFVDRYGLSRDAFIVPFTSEHLSTYLSICPSPCEAVVSFGPTDALMTLARKWRTNRLYNLLPHPAQLPGEKPRYISMLLSRNADKPRELVRDLYTKSWSAFDRLVSVIPPGGSIGLDDKVFSFWVLHGESFPFALVKGVFRFETGIKVQEFRDLRANPRSLIESQVLSLRVRYARMMATGVLPRSRSGSPSRNQQRRGLALGLSFDPYDHSLLPKRVIAVGSAANFPSVVSVLADIFNCPVFVPLSDASVANAGPRAKPAPLPSTGAGGSSAPPSGQSNGSLTPTHTSTSAAGANPVSSIAITMSAAATQAAAAAHLVPGTVPAPSRASAALGAAYLACWAYRRKIRPEDRFDSFEDEVRSLLRGGAEAARQERKATQTATQGLFSAPGSGASGSTTPLGRSALGIPSTLIERDEDESDSDVDGEDNRTQATDDDHVLVPHHFNSTGDDKNGLKASSSMSSSVSGSDLRSFSSTTTLVAPGMQSPGPLPSFGSNLSLNTATAGGYSALSASTSTPTTASAGQAATTPGASTSQPATLSVSPLPSDESDIDVGLVKVAVGDIDSFMTYASLIPEYCRLEGMLVKALV